MQAAVSPAPKAPLLSIVQQHTEEAAMLRHIRSGQVRAPNVKLSQLRRLDERIAAHLDGLSVAGSCSMACCEAALQQQPGVGEVFAMAVRAIESRNASWLDRLMAMCEQEPQARRGLLAALGWVSATLLQGIVRPMLESADATARELGIAACRLHRVDPGLPLLNALRDTHPALRAGALRAAGELGRIDLLDACRAAMADSNGDVAFWGAWSACLLGDRGASLSALVHAHSDAAWRGVRLALMAAAPSATPELMRRALEHVPALVNMRLRLRMSGLLGDVRDVPALIDAMANAATARVAGESFSFITGADLDALQLCGPALAPSGPTDDSDDDNVAMDEDEGLPWPDAALVARWWQANQARFDTHVRCFMGAAPSPGHCQHVLREGYQRQRLLAAEWLALMQPGHKLFAAAAPAWRQQRLLAAWP